MALKALSEPAPTHSYHPLFHIQLQPHGPLSALQMHPVASCLGIFIYTVLSTKFFLKSVSAYLHRFQLTYHVLKRPSRSPRV